MKPDIGTIVVPSEYGVQQQVIPNGCSYGVVIGHSRSPNCLTILPIHRTQLLREGRRPPGSPNQTAHLFHQSFWKPVEGVALGDLGYTVEEWAYLLRRFKRLEWLLEKHTEWWPAITRANAAIKNLPELSPSHIPPCS